MKLKSFGCSFIWGSELPDVPIPGNIPSHVTWPALLSRELNMQYECHAWPGRGNFFTAKQVLDQLARNEPTLYVINWTWIDRFDYVDVNDTWHGTTPWSTIMPADDTTMAKVYYRDLHSEYRDKFTALMAIRLVIDTLKQRGIPFIMTYMDDLIFDQRWHTTPAVMDLQKYVKPHMTAFATQTFLEWSRANNYAISTTFHPLEAAHRAAADYVIKVFRRQNTIDR